MTDITLFVAFVAGVVFGSLIMAVIVGSIAHSNYEKYLSMKATAFGLDQQLIDCYEGRTDRQWQMRSDGMDVKLEHKLPPLTPQHAPVVDLTMVEDDE